MVVVVTAVGVLMLGVGVAGLTDSRVDCEGEPMASDGKCITSEGVGRRGRRAVMRTYDEQRTANRRTDIVLTAAGGALLTGTCVVTVVVGARSRRTR